MNKQPDYNFTIDYPQTLPDSFGSSGLHMEALPLVIILLCVIFSVFDMVHRNEFSLLHREPTYRYEEQTFPEYSDACKEGEFVTVRICEITPRHKSSETLPSADYTADYDCVDDKGNHFILAVPEGVHSEIKSYNNVALTYPKFSLSPGEIIDTVRRSGSTGYQVYGTVANYQKTIRTFADAFSAIGGKSKPESTQKCLAMEEPPKPLAIKTGYTTHLTFSFFTAVLFVGYLLALLASFVLFRIAIRRQTAFEKKCHTKHLPLRYDTPPATMLDRVDRLGRFCLFFAESLKMFQIIVFSFVFFTILALRLSILIGLCIFLFIVLPSLLLLKKIKQYPAAVRTLYARIRLIATGKAAALEDGMPEAFRLFNCYPDNIALSLIMKFCPDFMEYFAEAPKKYRCTVCKRLYSRVSWQPETPTAKCICESADAQWAVNLLDIDWLGSRTAPSGEQQPESTTEE